MKVPVVVAISLFLVSLQSIAMEKLIKEEWIKKEEPAKEPVVKKELGFEQKIRETEEQERQEQELGKWLSVRNLLKQTDPPKITEADVYRALGFSGIPRPEQVLDSRLLNNPKIAPGDFKKVYRRLQRNFHPDTVARQLFDQVKAPKEFQIAKRKATVVSQVLNNAYARLGQ